MRIVISGGAGAMAWPSEIHLLEQPDVTEIVIVDRSEAIVEKRIAQLGADKRLKGKVIDLMDIKTSTELFEGADIVYNAAFKTTCTPATNAALEAGVNYVDLLGSNLESQRLFSDKFRKKGRLALLGCGTAPGMSNIMAAHGVNLLEKPESIEILDACVDIVPHTEHTRPLYWGYAIETIIDEFSDPAPYFNDGVMQYPPARSYPEVIDFRPPAGKIMVSNTDHSEQQTLSDTFKEKGVTHVSWKIGYNTDFEEKMIFMRDMGLFNKVPIDVDGQMVSPRALLLKLLSNQPPETQKLPDFRGHMIVVVKGQQGDKRVEYTITEYATERLTIDMQKKGIFSSYRTGLYAAIATLMIGRGQIAKKGALYPEECIPTDLFLKEAARVGIEVDVAKREWI